MQERRKGFRMQLRRKGRKGKKEGKWFVWHSGKATETAYLGKVKHIML
jgi:hypothetical protein